MTPKRIHALDYLRGVMAISILMYHLACWGYTEPTPDTLLGRLGVYAVSIFFILSGLSLTIAYDNKFNQPGSIKRYAVKRLLRIAPLFWVILTINSILSILKQIITQNPITLDIGSLILNYTFLFGLIDPTRSIPVAGWSIGIEMLFYLLFPIIILSYKNNKRFYSFIQLVALFVYVLFAFIILDPSLTPEKNWTWYANSLNHLFLFTSGIVIYYINVKPLNTKRNQFLLLVASIIGFTLLPVSATNSSYITGYSRLLFTAFSWGIVFSLYKLKPSFNNNLGKVLNALGDMTYSIYLIHPLIILKFAPPILSKLNLPHHSILLTVPVILILSYISYHWFEKPLTKQVK